MAKLITFLFLGISFCVIGIMNCKGNISTIHWYNRTKVTQQDAPKYGKAVGLGTIIIGVSIILSGVLEYAFKSEIWGASVIIGIVVGVGVILYGQLKYNKGIF